MNATLKNLSMIETHRGIAWIADLIVNDEIKLMAENSGCGGSTIIRGDRAVIASLVAWATAELPSDPEPLETIVSFTDENETLSVGLERAKMLNSEIEEYDNDID